jgi:serine protease Do
MRGVQVLFTGLAVAVLSTPTLSAQGTQPQRAPQARQDRVQMPRAGAVSMIGIRMSDVTADNMKTLKVSKVEGAVVEAVNSNSPAAAAGLRENDVIVTFDGERVRSASHLTRLVGETPAGREVAFSVMREGRKMDLQIKPEAGDWFDPRFGGMIDGEQIREYAEQAGRAAREMSRNVPEMMEGMRESMSSRGRLGATVQGVSPDLAEYFGVKSGVLVAGVAQNSAAAKAGLKAGDIITAVDGKVVASPSELIRALPTGEGSQDVNLTIVRDKKEQKMTVVLAPGSGGRNRTRRGQPV